jgi:hypothetical protein
MKNRLMFIGVAVVFIAASCARNQVSVTRPDSLSNKIILEWNEVAFRAFGGTSYQHSLMASRINAMTHLAMHDAVNAVKPVYATYVFNGMDELADPTAAAGSAAYTVLMHETPDQKKFLDSSLLVSLAAIPDGEAKKRGIELGRKAGLAIIEARASDGSASETIGKIPPSKVAGVYQHVPPFDLVFAPKWELVKPFSLQRKDQFRPGSYPALNSEAYAIAFKEIKSAGSKQSMERTGEQTAYAKFWYEFSEIGWNRVGRTVAADKKMELHETARLFALLNMALADAYIAGWDAKFYYNFWRPYTAVRAADIDGNPLTEADKNWEPLEATPPVHDYPSTHSALGNAGAAVLAALLGDQTAFTMTSFTAQPAGSMRSFQSFSQAANENADSRVQAGIHFRFSCIAGQKLGTEIGNWTADNYLKRLKEE